MGTDCAGKWDECKNPLPVILYYTVVQLIMGFLQGVLSRAVARILVRGGGLKIRGWGQVKPESGGGVLGEGAASPLPIS